eukprot:NODE_5679_length_494_cov_151.469663_g4245_i0.p2 GENE.NODE_5679_length_494_cov_151.469663_g4245_i0~~NODE_5679_length_494_cov_151.469663_g4245_i0.p2  ORF type:complete len:155 (-),score=57.16 NODE_5679_length_494_cov_151.469663_g4245_i0:29-472(-)
MGAIVEGKIFCTHSGLSPDLVNMEQIRQIPRPTDVPDTGLFCDLLWSEPRTGMRGWELNRGYCFGADVVEQFLVEHGFDLVIRSHQVVEDGYEFFGNQKLLTIFSAPDYCGEFHNDGAVLRIDADLRCSFCVLRCPAKPPKPPKLCA